MNSLNNIVEELIAQHRTLQKNLSEILNLLNSEGSNYDKICYDLNQFSLNLVEHLNLENGIFYLELLKRMKSKGDNTSATEMFIKQMTVIGVVVMEFLKKYQKAENIEMQIEKFKNELLNIISVLNIRIESEESGVYDTWNLYK